MKNVDNRILNTKEIEKSYKTHIYSSGNRRNFWKMCKILSMVDHLKIYRRFWICSKNIFFMFHILTINFLVPLRSVFSIFRPQMAGKLIFCLPILRNLRLWVKHTLFLGSNVQKTAHFSQTFSIS